MHVPHHIEVFDDRYGLPAVAVTLDLAPPEVAAGLHALRTVRDARFRMTQISTDDALALRELTGLVDTLADIAGASGVARLQMTVARLTALVAALVQFLAGEHLEREGDAEARPAVFELLDALEQINALAVRAALDQELQAAGARPSGDLADHDQAGGPWGARLASGGQHHA